MLSILHAFFNSHNPTVGAIIIIIPILYAGKLRPRAGDGHTARKRSGPGPPVLGFTPAPNLGVLLCLPRALGPVGP